MGTPISNLLSMISFQSISPVGTVLEFSVVWWWKFNEKSERYSGTIVCHWLTDLLKDCWTVPSPPRMLRSSHPAERTQEQKTIS